MLANLLDFTLRLSLTGTIIAIVIIIVKKVSGKLFSARWHYVIWFLLLVKLLIPFTVSSNVSLFNLINPSDKMNFLSYQNSAHDTFNRSVDALLTEPHPLESTQTNNVRDIKPYNSNNQNSFGWTETAACIWLAGVLVMLLMAVLSCRKTLVRTKKPLPEQQEYIFSLLRECTNNNKKLIKKINVRLSDYYSSPFIIGVFRPSLIIPCNILNSIDMENLKYILIHELTHLKYKDHIVRIICYLLQAIHWFNPIIWISLRLMSRDCEIACDSAVIRSSNTEMRKNYAMLLLKTAQMSNTRRSIIPRAAFSQSNLKKRIINITRFRKHSTASFVAAVIILGVLTGVLITGAADKKLEILSDSFDNVQSIWLSQYIGTSTPGSSLVGIGSNQPIMIHYSYSNMFADSNTVGQSVYYQKNLNKTNDETACRSYYDKLYDMFKKNTGRTLLKHSDNFENPNLSIEINYKDGHTDFIASDSKSNKIYRVLGNGNYLECTNPEILPSIVSETLNTIFQSTGTITGTTDSNMYYTIKVKM